MKEINTLTLAYVSSAYNEFGNLEELHRRCRVVHQALSDEFRDRYDLQFRMLIADNCSQDASLTFLKGLIQSDPSVTVLEHMANYGVEASYANLIDQAQAYDLVVLLCSDLQDPPEISLTMVRSLLEQPNLDAVLAVKKSSKDGQILRVARRSYYRALGLSSRRAIVPNGFHGFGCYRKTVLEQAVHLGKCSDLNVRQCLVNACNTPMIISYDQPARKLGTSSYRGLGYWVEALRALLSGDAAASRLALTTGTISLGLAALVGLFVLINTLLGTSRYSAGLPTVMGLILISFALQMLMIAILSRQIEAIRMGGLRRRVLFRTLSSQR